MLTEFSKKYIFAFYFIVNGSKIIFCTSGEKIFMSSTRKFNVIFEKKNFNNFRQNFRKRNRIFVSPLLLRVK